AVEPRPPGGQRILACGLQLSGRGGHGAPGQAWHPQAAAATPSPQQAVLSPGPQQPAWSPAVQHSAAGVSAAVTAKYWRRFAGTVAGPGGEKAGLPGSAPPACRMIASTMSPSGGSWL